MRTASGLFKASKSNYIPILEYLNITLKDFGNKLKVKESAKKTNIIKAPNKIELFNIRSGWSRRTDMYCCIGRTKRFLITCSPQIAILTWVC